MSVKTLQVMIKIFIGIDISKEKLNFCFRTASEIVCEEEIENTSTAIKRLLRRDLRALETAFEYVLVCAEYTGRYIYPLTCACQDLGLFLWMEDPTRIKTRSESPEAKMTQWMPGESQSMPSGSTTRLSPIP